MDYFAAATHGIRLSPRRPCMQVLNRQLLALCPRRKLLTMQASAFVDCDRLRLALVCVEGGSAAPWDAMEDYGQYCKKVHNVSQVCRLDHEDERALVDKLLAKGSNELNHPMAYEVSLRRLYTRAGESGCVPACVVETTPQTQTLTLIV